MDRWMIWSSWNHKIMVKSDMAKIDLENSSAEMPKLVTAELPKSATVTSDHPRPLHCVAHPFDPLALHNGVQIDPQALSPQGSGAVDVLAVGCVLYQPEIPGNTGTLMRLSACWNAPLALIGPLGFVWSDKHLKRASMDYAQHSKPTLHDSWQDYMNHWAGHTPRRTIAVVPREGVSYRAFVFQPGDHLIMGSESCGLPHQVISECNHVVHIPMQPSARSMNLAIASALVWAEALFQTQQPLE